MDIGTTLEAYFWQLLTEHMRTILLIQANIKAVNVVTKMIRNRKL